MDAIERLVAIEEIKLLKARYCRYIDEKNWAGLHEIWAPDAIFDLRAGGQVDPDADSARSDRFTEEGLLSGREQIIAKMRSFCPEVSVHSAKAPEIEILSSTEARGIWVLEDRCWWAGGVPYNTLHGFGHWRDTYRRIDGRWMKQSCRVTRIRVDVS